MNRKMRRTLKCFSSVFKSQELLVGARLCFCFCLDLFMVTGALWEDIVLKTHPVV